MMKKLKGRIALSKIKKAEKKGELPENSRKLYRAIRKAGLDVKRTT